MTVQCEQFIFGKLVSKPDGPIIPGVEHGCTGLSSNFPKALEAFCHPSVLGLGKSENFSWQTYYWREERGGIVSAYVPAGGQAWRVAGRIYGRSEQGEHESAGRAFVQAHFIAIPASSWRPALAPSLERHLWPDAMLTQNMDLPPLLIDDAPYFSQPFPDDWRTNPMLENLVRSLVSGQPVGIQDRNMDQIDVLNLFSQAMSLLPAPLSQRLAFGSRLGRTDGQVALAHAWEVDYPHRYIGVAWKSPPPDEDWVQADAYWKHLVKCLPDGLTYGELEERMAELWPSSPVRPIPIDRPWDAVARDVLSRLVDTGRLSALRDWLERPVEVLPSMAFTSMRLDVLDILVDVFPVSLPLMESVASWEEMRDLDGPPSFKALKRLLLSYRLTLDELECLATLDLHSSLAEKAIDALEDLITQDRHAGPWLSWASHASQDMDWVVTWRSQTIGLSRLALAAFAAAASSDINGSLREAEELLARLPDAPLAMALRNLYQGYGWESDIQILVPLFRAVGPSDMTGLQGLLEAFKQLDSGMAISVAELLMKAQSKEFMWEALLPGRSGEPFAERLADHISRNPGHEVSPIMAEIVASHWARLSASVRGEAEAWISGMVGGIHGVLLGQGKVLEPGPLNGYGPSMTEGMHVPLERTWTLLRQSMNKKDIAFFGAAIVRDLRKLAKGSLAGLPPALGYIYEVAYGGGATWPVQANDVDWNLTREILFHGRNADRLVDQIRMVTDPSTARRLIQILPTVGSHEASDYKKRFPLSPSVELIASMLDESRYGDAELLARHGLDKEESWRLLMPTYSGNRINEKEVMILEYIGIAGILNLSKRNFKFPNGFLDSINVDQIKYLDCKEGESLISSSERSRSYRFLENYLIYRASCDPRVLDREVPGVFGNIIGKLYRPFSSEIDPQEENDRRARYILGERRLLDLRERCNERRRSDKKRK
ncbi:hypothetical protein [Rhodospirillum sp. A1_3_36]|uniref:hypothetical protein n=1 Tax=Rhodospirillum sp. A1_3_36 TaxID=3391666 RepID=UPI0039A6B45F